MLRPRRRGVGLVAGAMLLFLAGTNIQSGWLFVLSSLLLGAAVAGTILPVFMVRGLEVERRGPAEAYVGDEVPVELVVSNRARTTRLSVTVRDRHVAPAAVFLSSIRPGERLAARTVRLATRRGTVENSPLEVASSAPLGVAEARRSIRSEGPGIVVYPRVLPVHDFSLLERAAAGPADLAPSARRGEGTDFLGVREYRPGDSLRRVHWPSTARRGSLVVREMERERPASLAILVDTWADAGRDDGDSALDLCSSVAASAAEAALARGHEVLLGGSLGGEARRPARMGRTEALTWLAGLEAPGGPPFPVVVEEAAAAPGGSDAYLLVLGTWQSNNAGSLTRPVRSLLGLGSRVLVVLVRAERFGGRARVLSFQEVEALERILAASGAEVRSVGSVGDVAAALSAPAIGLR